MTAVFHWDSFWWPEAGRGYAFWSSFGSCLAYFSIIGLIYRKINCHVTGCLRVGIHHVEGTSYFTCRKHHPKARTTVADIHDAHARAHEE